MALRSQQTNFDFTQCVLAIQCLELSFMVGLKTVMRLSQPGLVNRTFVRLDQGCAQSASIILARSQAGSLERLADQNHAVQCAEYDRSNNGLQLWNRRRKEIVLIKKPLKRLYLG